MTKHDAITEYFKTRVGELTGEKLEFNNSQEAPNSFSIVTNYSDKVRKKYIRTGAEKEYAFSVIIVKAYSAHEDDLNLEAMNFAQSFLDWIEEQNKLKNYPEFPENCQIKSMECLQNMPNLAGINSQAGLARYMIQCRLIYFEKETQK